MLGGKLYQRRTNRELAGHVGSTISVPKRMVGELFTKKMLFGGEDQKGNS